MDSVTKKKVGEKLLHEIDTLCQFYFRQTLDEVITELRIRCIISGRINDPVHLITDLHRCGFLNCNSTTPVVYLRKAIERFAGDSFGLCVYCGEIIPEEWLLRNPLIEYCSHCMLQARSSHTIEREKTEEFQTTIS